MPKKSNNNASASSSTNNKKKSKKQKNASSSTSASPSIIPPPSLTPEQLTEFHTMSSEFITDFIGVYPEYADRLSRFCTSTDTNSDETYIASTTELFHHCWNVYLPRFFDIIYKNSEIFSTTGEHSNTNVCFLPYISFKEFWNLEDTTDDIRNNIWKYLQLILMFLCNFVTDISSFSESASFFEFIDADELKGKMEEICNVFTQAAEAAQQQQQQQQQTDGSAESQQQQQQQSQPNAGSNPFSSFMEGGNADAFMNRMQEMMDGKLGRLALELGEEIAAELKIDSDEVNPMDVIQKFLKNPAKLFNMIKKVNEKIQKKMDDGELNQSEMYEEGMEFINKMKDTPEMNNMFNTLLSSMGMKGAGGKMNMGAMSAAMGQQHRKAKQADRLRSRLEQKRNLQRTEEMIRAMQASSSGAGASAVPAPK